MAVTERSFQVNGYQLAAREWHPDAELKVIACHGWLDNAASYDHLAPLLNNCHVLALDMPGHGHSDHKSPQANYNIWDDLLDIIAIADAMAWPTFNLLGHSRGAIISMLLSAAMPERIAALVMLDAIYPQPVDIEDTAKQLNKYLSEQLALADKRLPSYPSIDKALAARCRAANMSEAAARPIVERGLYRMQDGCYGWRSDPRLTTSSALKFTRGHIKALLSAIEIPNLLLLAEDGLGANKEMTRGLELAANINIRYMPGSHFFHLEQQAAAIAEAVDMLFAKHAVQL